MDAIPTTQPEGTNDVSAVRLVEREELSHKRTLELTTRQHRVEMLRIAQQVLLENSRTLPTEQRAVSADDITAYAGKLLAFIGD